MATKMTLTNYRHAARQADIRVGLLGTVGIVAAIYTAAYVGQELEDKLVWRPKCENIVSAPAPKTWLDVRCSSQNYKTPSPT